MGTWAIGDIHGNREALDDLLGAVEPQLEPTDELVFLGDYIDDGPEVAGCIQRILDLRKRAPCPVVGLMGNHEQWMLRSRTDATRHSWLLGMGGLRTVASYSEHVAEAIRREIDEAGAAWYLSRTSLDYGRFFQSMPAEHLAFFLDLRVHHRTGDVLCVHGGAVGLEALDEYPADVFIWGPPGFPDGYEATAPVVYGHRNNAVLDEAGWPHPHVTRNVAFGIDTIRHGVLTAMRFPDHLVVQSRRFDPV